MKIFPLNFKILRWNWNKNLYLRNPGFQRVGENLAMEKNVGNVNESVMIKLAYDSGFFQ